MGDGEEILQGIVSSGVKDGAFFMSLKPYVQAMQENLGYLPFKGTLNLKVNKQKAQKFISSLETIEIDGFRKGIKQFGKVKCHPCKTNNIPCAIVIPEFTRYDLDIIEVISEKELRKTIDLKDGDKLTLKPK